MPSYLTSAQITIHEKRKNSETISKKEAEDCLEKIISEASHNHPDVAESLEELRKELEDEDSAKNIKEIQEEMWDLSMKLRGPGFSIQEVL